MASAGKRLLAEWRREAERQGWTVRHGRAGHLKWYRPNGSYACSTAHTPSQRGRSMDNTRAALRRAGLKID